MKTWHFSPWTLHYCAFCYLSWIQFELVHKNSILICQSSPDSSHALQHLSLHLQMQSPLAQRSSVNNLVSSGRAQDHSQLTDSEGMTAHFPGLLFTTAWRLRSAESLHIAPPARVPGRECWLLAPICQHSTQLHPQIFNCKRGFGANPIHFCLMGRWIP